MEKSEKASGLLRSTDSSSEQQLEIKNLIRSEQSISNIHKVTQNQFHISNHARYNQLLNKICKH